MKKILSVALVCATLILAAGCGQRANKKAQTPAAEPEQTEVDTTKAFVVVSDEPIFDIITSMGTIRVQLYANTPKHRDNFVKLATSGFYDGLLFHRVIPGFMIQGGDPLTKDEANADRFGTGDTGYTVPNEIAAGNLHKLGALCAARKGDMANPKRESSGCQFYIVQDEAGCAGLNGQYTVYGQTLEGFDVIDAIANVETNQRNCPLTPVRIIKVIPAE